MSLTCWCDVLAIMDEGRASKALCPCKPALLHIDWVLPEIGLERGGLGLKIGSDRHVSVAPSFDTAEPRVLVL